MKIRIELDESLTEDEVVIRSSSLGEQVRKIEQAVSEIVNAGQKFVFYKDDTEYYLPLDAICFFETEGNVVYAHTKNDMFLYVFGEVKALRAGGTAARRVHEGIQIHNPEYQGCVRADAHHLIHLSGSDSGNP